ncbi:MAG: 3-beta hydroxysteroid dehydrogenase [Opitutae bacterium]|nr:3-beta hydroxysteroid dehydrogenase [Opitutae bacterium]
MKIVVTGGAGFIGTRIVRGLLKKGHEVEIIGRSSAPRQPEVRFHKIDLSNNSIPAELCKGVDAFFHVAAKAGIWGTAESYESANVAATRQVVQACLANEVRFLVHTSTPSVVFNGQPFKGAGEELPYGSNWLCHYARTKAIAEKDVLAANSGGKLKTIALRPHLVWGPGDPHLLPKVVSKARAGKLAIVGDGSNLVDLTHVENAAHAHLVALEALAVKEHPGGKAYFISQGEPTRLWSWLNDLLHRLNEPRVIRKISFRKAYWMGFALECAWKVLRRKTDPPMTRFVATQLAKDHWFDGSAAEKDLGYKPVVSMEDGLQETIAWLKSDASGAAQD